MNNRTACKEATDCIVGTSTYAAILGGLAVGCGPKLAGSIADVAITCGTCGICKFCKKNEQTNRTEYALGDCLGNVTGIAGGVACGLVGCVVGTLFAPIAACTGAPQACQLDNPGETVSNYRFGGPALQVMK